MGRRTFNLIDEINKVAEEINNILNEKRKDRYFEGIIVLYTFIENILTWLVFLQILWHKAAKTEMHSKEVLKLKNYCNQLSFYSLLALGLAVDLLDYDLYKKIDDARKERNQIVHQYWLYIHKGRKAVFRKKLEKLARIANLLVGKLNNLVEETGVDDTYGLFEIRSGKHVIP